MAYNPSDTVYYIIKEVTAGTTPATPAFLKVGHKDGTKSSFKTDTITSGIIRPSRAGNGSSRVKGRSEIALATELRKDTANDLLLESALSGVFATNVLKAGLTDTSFTTETTYTEGATKEYVRHTACQVSKLAISGKYDSFIDYNFEIMGTAESVASTIISGATYTADSTNASLNGSDTVTITIDGTPYDFLDFNIEVSHNREVNYKLGAVAGMSIGTSGMREVKMSFTLYHSPALRTLLATNSPRVVSVTIGAATNGYTFLMPRAFATVPENDIEGASVVDKVEFMAAYDATEATDLKVTRL